MSEKLLAGYWGKYDGESNDYHALVHHSADVAACLEALLEQPNIRNSLARSGGLDSLTSGQASRLAAITFLHDLGKIAMGFQCQIVTPLPRGSPAKKGHILPIFSCLFSGDEADSWLAEALDAQALALWDDREGETIQELLAAALAHHGAPVSINIVGEPNEYRRQWLALEHLDPAHEASRFGRYLRQWFPHAFLHGHEPLPQTTAFQHAYAGLVSLADWIGSDSQFFPFHSAINENHIAVARLRATDALKSIGLDIQAQRARFEGTPTSQHLFQFEALRPLQQATFDAPNENKILILEAETGAGKTEAALMRFAKLYEAGEVDSLYFAVPTRAAAVQLHRRISDFCRQLFPAELGPQPVLAVPGYIQAGDVTGKRLPGFVVEWDDSPDKKALIARWAAEHHKRYLAAQIAVGTVDQVMLSAMPVKHAHLRAAALSRSLLVIDELHASDHYMQEIIERVVKQHTALGSHVLMMSATLTASARERWLLGQRQSATSLDSAIAVQYPCISYREHQTLCVQSIAQTNNQKEISVSLTANDLDEISSLAWSATRSGARVLIIRNTVNGAVELLQKLKADAQSDTDKLFNINGVVTLHHSRFAAEDRKRLDAAAEAWLGKDRPIGGAIVVGTQTLEQSLDIDADLLITDLCPVDVLLQRMGRLHRHTRDNRPTDYCQAKAVVISPHNSDLSGLLEKSESGLGPKSHVYGDLIALQATLDLLNSRPLWRIPEMNRSLIEGALHPTVRHQVLDLHDHDWKTADQQRNGSETADAQSARMHRLRTDLDFLDKNIRFPDKEIRIPTRLGGDSLLVTLEPAITGPFGGLVSHFSIPDWMLGEQLDSSQQALGIEEKDCARLILGALSFAYDSNGLSKSTEHS